jgi:hypothetical protein
MESLPYLHGSPKDERADSFTYDTEKAIREAEPPRATRRETLKDITAHNIKRQSKTGKKLDVVRAWVEHASASILPEFEGNVCYVDNMSVPVLVLIAEGVSHFRLSDLPPD